MKPIRRTYNAGSIIYFEGDRGGDIYVLQEGGVSLLSTSLDGESESSESVKKGEFFGVKSSLGKYPREETARVLRDSIILVFSPVGFEEFALANTRLILQMLRVFSSNLRKIHHKVRSLLGEREEGDTSNDLLSVAEYYHKKNNYSHAAYAYRSYLKNYSSSALKERAERMLSLAESQKIYPPNLPTIEQDLSNRMSNPAPKAVAAPSLSLGDNSLQDDSALDFADDFSLDDGMDDEGGAQGAKGLYFSAMNAISAEEFGKAESQLQAILKLDTVPPAEETYIQKAYYDFSRVLGRQKKWKQALDAYSVFIRKYPRSEMLRKAMNEMAAIYEANNNVAKAIAFYQSVSKMTPEDKFSIAAMNKLKELSK